MALVVTNRGRFGICHGDAEDGDVVTLPPNGQPPLLLRPWEASGITTGGEFRMVGAGFFAGVIEDECVDPERLGSLQQKDTREYVVV